ncbi:MAG: glycosyltransferase [Roseomonas sp.]|nr:glycosyltransferase [Roseomonas sp.]MCA3408282.1 glycosyltransferase [Roseomonas sp.]
MKKPEFSVLLPTRNRASLLVEAIESVRSQNFEDWEIIVSDNASIEDVQGIIKKFDDPRIVYLRSDEPLSVTDNWNRAIDAAQGSWIVMLGDDDGLVPGYFENMLAASVSLNSPDIIYHGAYHFLAPDVLPGQTDGRLSDVTKMHSLLLGHKGPSLLPRDQCEAAARAALDMRAIYGFNMQYFLFRAEFLDRMRRFGPVFRGPYPDFYAANMALFIADTVGVVPAPMTVIGITRKSYGYYHFNNNESAGMDFLANQDFTKYVSADLRKHLLPGSFMNTLWLVSVALVLESLPKAQNLQLGVKRYRRLQILDAGLNHSAKGSAAARERDALLPLLSAGERMLLLALRVASWPLTLLPPRWLGAFSIRAKCFLGQYDTGEGPRRLSMKPRNMTEAIEMLRNFAEDQKS